MGKVADPLRQWADIFDYHSESGHTTFSAEAFKKAAGDMRKTADEIDADHESRMEQCRRETKKAAMRYLNSVIVDYMKHSMKRDRKEMLDKYEKKGRTIR